MSDRRGHTTYLIYLIAIDNIVSPISLSLRQADLFDQLLDLRAERFLVRLFIFFGGLAPDRARL